MKYFIYNKPVPKSLHDYHFVIFKVARFLSKDPGFITLYQGGSIGNPGISDIDLLAVFEDGVSCKLNPFNILDSSEKYFFTHGIFGICKSHFEDLKYYASYLDLYPIESNTAESPKPEIIRNPINDINIQIAMEYLFLNYVARNIEKITGMISLRNVLLSLKAIRLDLEILEINSGSLCENIIQLINRRNNWFEHKFIESEFYDCFIETINLLSDLLQNILHEYPFFLSDKQRFKLGRNIVIEHSSSLNIEWKGIKRLPSVFSIELRKKMLKLLQHIYVSVPYKRLSGNPILNSRNLFYKNYFRYNNIHFPFLSAWTNNILTYS